MRDIAEGEELCICYGTVLTGLAERRARLQAGFKFMCECVACVREGQELKASDERRATIARLYDEIAGCGANPAVGVRKVSSRIGPMRDWADDVCR